ncbi:MAG TPA: hypothetical protein PKZ32_20145 [Candidatus Melainabacteria bacterium]|nr:hypothetical protein [Candidatus Melainabacteria bacterium]
MSTVLERKTKTHAICPFLILGVERNASRLVVEEAYWRLFDGLDEGAFLHSPQAWVQAAQAQLEVENAYARIINGEFEEADEEGVEPFWPKFGQILIAAGKINIRQLQFAIEEQEVEHRPLGEILLEQGLINRDELEAVLSTQVTMELPDDSPYLFGLRLIGLRVVPEDMVCIALIEYCDSGTPVEQTLLERGWLAAEVLEAISKK